MSKMTITNNGKIGKAINITGSNIVISGNRIMVDGKDVELPEAKIFNIMIEGETESVKVDNAELVSIQGNCKTVSTVNGNVNTSGDIQNVTTTNGDVSGKNITGTISTVNGNINNFNK